MIRTVSVGPDLASPDLASLAPLRSLPPRSAPLVLSLVWISLCLAWLSAPGLAAQETRIETAGTVFAIMLPATAAAAIWLNDDRAGRPQFYWSFGTNLAVTLALKRAISKERPDGSDNESFPSGHTSVAFQGASFIHLRYGLRYGIPAYAAAAFVGYSREYAGKHYWIDIVSGAALGTLSSVLFTDRFEGVQLSPTAAGGGYGLQVRVAF